MVTWLLWQKNTHIYVQKHSHTVTQIHIHIHTQNIHTLTHTYTHMYTHTLTHTDTCYSVHSHTHTHTQMHTYIHALTHTHNTHAYEQLNVCVYSVHHDILSDHHLGAVWNRVLHQHGATVRLWSGHQFLQVCVAMYRTAHNHINRECTDVRVLCLLIWYNISFTRSAVSSSITSREILPLFYLWLLLLLSLLTHKIVIIIDSQKLWVHVLISVGPASRVTDYLASQKLLMLWFSQTV